MISILLPALGSARGAAQSLKCKAALRSLGTAWLNYANFNRGWITTQIYSNVTPAGGLIVTPTASQLAATPPVVDYKGGYLSRYLSQTAETRNCPLIYGGQSNVTGATGGTIDQLPVSYAYSPYVLNMNQKAITAGTTPTATASSLSLAISRVKSPSDTFWYGDSAAFTTLSSATLKNHSFLLDFLDMPGTQTFNAVTYTPPGPRRLHGRHKGKANVLWFDGHVDEVTPNYSNPTTTGSNTPELRKQLKMGDLMPPGVNYGDADQNYYFWKDKISRQ
ncbi:MAG: hypothetical protein QM754_05260 [Tepidisphaeraceae bacterium]